jgi:hypothetical protein
VTVSLDDFSSGYSSVAYLIPLPVDRIKIDKSFVQELTVEETCHHAHAMVQGWWRARWERARSPEKAPKPKATRSRQEPWVRCRAGILQWQAAVGRRAFNLTPRHDSGQRRPQIHRRKAQEADRGSGKRAVRRLGFKLWPVDW